MDQTPRRPRHASDDAAAHVDEPTVVRPRRLYIEDGDDAGSRTSETLWRAVDRTEPQTPAPATDDEAAAAPTSQPPSPTQRRRPTLRRSLGLTTASTLLPGLGLIGARQHVVRVAGMLVAGGSVALTLVALAWFAGRVTPDGGESWLHAALSAAVGVAVGRGTLHVLTVAVLALGIVWVALIATTNLATRPTKLGRGKRALSAVVVGVLSFLVATPIAVSANYAQVLASTLGSTFAKQGDVVAGSNPSVASGPDPFPHLDRINILLLGSDLDERRIERNTEVEDLGLRTDTIMLASVDKRTGQTAIVQIPRNVQYTPFPADSPLHELYPDGYRGDGAPDEWYINALWTNVEHQHPELYAGQTYPGAEALKDGVTGITGLDVHYFVMLNIDGLRHLIDAMGGVTVNINERLPIGGSSERPDLTSGYLEVGPSQHLDGYHAMWYARSRWMSSDYSRMERQSCLVKAITDQANPGTLLTRFEAIAGASSAMVQTDIPAEALEALTDLALKVPNQEMRRLVFAHGENGYDYNDPDFPRMRELVAELIDPPAPTPTPTPTPSPSPSESAPAEGEPEPSASPSPSEGAQVVADACAFHPEEEQE